jgi:anti-anti-sigma regulatory factor
MDRPLRRYMTDPTQEAVRVHRTGDTAHLSLHGAVDLFVASTLRELAARELPIGRDWIIECKELERIDASVLQILLVIEREVCARGGVFALHDVRGPVERYLGVAGASTLLTRIARPEREPAQLAARLQPSDGSAAPDRSSSRAPTVTGGDGPPPEDEKCE